MTHWRFESVRLKVWALAVIVCGQAALTSTSALAQTPLGTVWTYQGQLTMSGSPLNGTADFRFTLFDAAVGGNMVGSVVARNNIAVADGLFTVELDFGGAAFAGDARWLNIAVRSPAGGGAFTALSDRQPLNAAPYALFALTGNQGPQGPAGSNSLWQVLGTTMHYDNGFVGVGRNNRITGAEVFGIHKPGTGYGGMYTSTGAGGLPFYGYYTGTEVGWSYLDGATGDWKLYLDGVRMTVTDQGNVGIGTTTPLQALHVLSSGSSTALVGNTSTVTSAIGVHGLISSTAPGSFSSAVRGENRGTAGLGIGVWGSQDGAGWGVYGTTVGGSGVYGVASATSGTNFGVVGQSASTGGYDFYANGAGVNYGASSSIRWKSNVEPISDPLSKLAQLQGVYFDWDSEHGGHHDVGMIAEEVGAVLPEIVNFEENGIDANGMDYSKMTPLLVEAVNALRAEKNSQIAALQDENDALRARLEALEQLVERLASQQEDER